MYDGARPGHPASTLTQNGTTGTVGGLPPSVRGWLGELEPDQCAGGPTFEAPSGREVGDDSEAPAVDIRVLPYACGAHVTPEGAFMIFELPEPYPDVAFIDTPAGGIYVEADEVERLKSKCVVFESYRLIQSSRSVVYTRAEWDAFLAGVRADEFDFQ
ncbi:Scr1 family TA system antitoxin-like transcriptional regulator [Sphaerisporangium album]|nr:Scr1 family TA system antitoxin-like transcriptional regulator [Sphaerisporangium album]